MQLIELNENEYKKFTESNNAHFLQSYEWGELSKTRGFIPYYVGLKKDNDIASSKDQLSLLNEEKLGLMREKEENDEQIAILDEEIAKVNEEVKSYDKKIDLVASKKMMALSLLSLDEEVEAKLDQKFMNDNGIEVILKRER